MNKKILITGVAGFIGSKVAERFIDEGFHVYGVDDLSSGKEKNIPKGLEFIKLDLSEGKKFSILPRNCKIILHLAGQSSGEISFDNPILDLKKNTLSTINLINYGVSNKSERIVYASSMSVYGNYNKKKLKENFMLKPLSCYGAGKLASENYLEIYKKKISYVSLRMFNVYGPGQNLENLRQGMVSIYLAQAIKNAEINVRGSLNRVRDFIYIDDVVNIWFKASSLTNILNQKFNVGTSKSIKVRELINLLIKKFPKCKIKELNGTPGDQYYVCSDNLLLKRKFNYKKFISLNESLNRFVNSVLK